jgi:hypothetical protein
VTLATRKLNSATLTLERWFEKWTTKTNASECSIILFCGRRSHYRFSLCHAHINWTNQVKYPGVALSSKLTYRYQTNKSLCKATHRQAALSYPILSYPILVHPLIRNHSPAALASCRNSRCSNAPSCISYSNCSRQRDKREKPGDPVLGYVLRVVRALYE